MRKKVLVATTAGVMLVSTMAVSSVLAHDASEDATHARSGITKRRWFSFRKNPRRERRKQGHEQRRHAQGKVELWAQFVGLTPEEFKDRLQEREEPAIVARKQGKSDKEIEEFIKEQHSLRENQGKRRL